MHPMSKSQLQAFMARVQADAALRERVDQAADASAVAAIAAELGHPFSPASWTRHLRG
ncbi:MAG: hypothetical protein RLZZ459_1058 [Cyanobacteriota bacterium]|jgi:predicted ribosomally synthesized peptide with nif11-like leader